MWRKADIVSYCINVMFDPRTQGLLLEEKEASVNQLDELGKVVELLRLAVPAVSDSGTYVVQNDQLVCPSTVVVANGVEETVTNDRGD